MEGVSARVPVFVFPHSLEFYLSSRQTHKQILTLYNPYEFPVRFKILTTSPNKYSVVDPDGSIGPCAGVDILIRHTAPVSSNCNAIDKFRIVLQDHSTKKVLGKRDVEAKLLSNDTGSTSTEGDNFLSLGLPEKHSEDQQRIANEYPLMHNYRNTRYHQNNPSVVYISALLLFICSVALLWPTQQDALVESTFIPPYLYITNTVKLVFAYVLGIVTMVILKP